MNKKTIWITRTAVLTAMLLALQFVTKAFGQLVTGSCVNMVLTLAALYGGWWCALAVALLSPLFAFLLGIGPALVAIVPAIAAGNTALVAVLVLLHGKLPDYLGAVCAAITKFVLLWLTAVKIILPLLGLPEQKLAVLTAMFTWPQLITALIGGILGVIIFSVLIKGRKK